VTLTNKEFSELYLEYINVHREKGISVDATNICPLQCPYCPRQKEIFKQKIRTSKMMPLGDFRKMISFCDNRIRICGQMSDPIYHPQFLSIIKETQKHLHKKFSFHTNGTRKKMSWWKSVFENSKFNVRFVFGLDGTDQETSNIYRVNTRHDEVMEVMKLGVSMGVDIVWQFIVFKHNEHQVEDAIRIAQENKLILEIIKSDKFDPVLVEKYKVYPPSEKWSIRNSEGQNGFVKNIVWIYPK
jgi:MoaA/NifB/PqqE/SkfB family radical SAM enzyme